MASCQSKNAQAVSLVFCSCWIHKYKSDIGIDKFGDLLMQNRLSAGCIFWKSSPCSAKSCLSSLKKNGYYISYIKPYPTVIILLVMCKGLESVLHLREVFMLSVVEPLLHYGIYGTEYSNSGKLAKDI